MKEWNGGTLMMISEAKETLQNNSSDGIAIITAHIAVDSNGKPLLWVVPNGKRVEPSRDAKEILIHLLSS
jgi:hypothetical protein